MSSLLQNTIFGNKNRQNTFIGGVASTLNTSALIAARLGLPVNRIKSFAVTGDDIQFTVIGGTYSLPNGAFSGTALTYYKDTLGLVTSINTSFQNCKSLTSVYFPNLTAINASFAFSGCSSISAYNLPNLTTISGNYTFADNTSLNEFNAPNLILSASNKFVFYGSNNLAVLNIGKATGIGEASFQNTKITVIDLSNCTAILGGAFGGCILLENIRHMNLVTTIDLNAFYNCSSLLNFSANTVTSINNAFNGCSSLTALSFPSLISISGNYAFANCTKLISFQAAALRTINNGYTFHLCSSLKTFNAPNLVLKSSNEFTFLGANNLSFLTIASPIGLGQQVFVGTKITAIDLSETISIGPSAFAGCNLLTGVVNMNLAATIDLYAFYNCSSLLNFSANAVTSINNAFNGCSSLTALSFPSLISISGNYAFANCTKLISFEAPLLKIINNNYTFHLCSSLTTFNVPNLVLKSSNEFTFLGANNLSFLTISSPLGLGQQVFIGTKITAINLSETTSIGPSAFAGCTLLNNVHNLSNTTFIGNNAFSGCASLTTSITSAATTLGILVFQGCALIPSYNFPNLTIIGSSIFNGCSSVDYIYMPLLIQCGSTTGLNDIFFNIKTGCTITVATSLSTNNSGAPDGDLVYAKNSRGATIVYV